MSGRASENFYRNAFALAAFAAFVTALLTEYPVCYAVALVFGAFSRTAVKKGWANPAYARYFPWLVRRAERIEEDR